MTRYKSRVLLPATVRAFLAPWFAQGRVALLDDSSMTFEFETADLWDAARLTAALETESNNTIVNEGMVTVGKPTEVMPAKYEPVREGEWLSAKATPIYRCLKIAMDAARAEQNHALVNIIQGYRTELNSLFGDMLKDNPDLTKEG